MTTLVMVAIVVAGLVGFRELPVSDLPKIDNPTIEISATLPGADPETMAATVATPLERQCSGISGIEAMTSSSSLGKTQVTLQFALDRDIDAAAQDVQAAIAGALKTLPSEMSVPPTWRKVNPAELPILFMALRSQTMPLSQLNTYADTLIAQRLSMVSGVAQVSIFGSQKFALRIQVDPGRLASHDLGMEELAEAINRGNSNRPLGTLWGTDRSWAMQTDAGLERADEFRPLIVAWKNGVPIHLEEVANVIDGVQNNKVAAWHNDSRVVMIAVYRQPGSNTVAIVDAVRAVLPQLQERLPQQAGIEIIIDRSQSIRASIMDVQLTLILTAALVVLIIFVFLRRISATLIPALSLPLSLIGTFAVMAMLDFSIDNISLVALTLVTGFVVDDAIVVLENIVRRMEGGETAEQAALAGSRQIAFTVISMTISLMAVFIPVACMSGVLGRLFQEFAVTVMVAIFVSGVVSLTLVPMMCSRFLHHRTFTGGAGGSTNGPLFSRVLAFYTRTLDIALHHRRLVLASLFVSSGLVAWLLVIIPKGMIPNEDLGQIRIQTEYAADITFDDMVKRQRQVAVQVSRNEHVHSFMSNIGNDGSNQGSMSIRLKDRPERKVTPEAVIGQLRKETAGIPGVKITPQVLPPIRIGGRVSKAQYQYTLQGADTGQLYPAAQSMLKQLADIRELTDVSSDMQLDHPRVKVHIDRDRAATLGISAARIESTLGLAYGGRQVSTIYTDADQYQVILEVDPALQGDTTQLSSVYIRPDLIDHGELVQLGVVARISTAVGPLSINHQGQLPAVTISFNLGDGVALGTAVERIESCAQRTLPDAISGSFTGAAQVFQDSLTSMGVLLLLSIGVIYIVLGILYESFIHPLTILSGLPSAALGALTALLICGNELNVYSFIGVILLIGIVKKNAIMMIDFAIQARVEQGLDAMQAIRQGCITRFRPIMMTTVAALIGALPLTIGIGTVSNSRHSLGIAVVGGLLISQLITLYLTPVIYLYLDRLQEWIRVRWLKGKA